MRIIALGVLLPQPSLFVNPNAHLLLHPPLLRGLAEAPEDVDEQIGASKQLPVARTPTAAAAPSSNTNEAYFPLAQSISPSGSATTIHGLGEGALPSSSAAVPASSPSLRSTITKAFSSGRSRRASTSGDGPDEAGGSRLGGILTQVRSRDSDDGRRRTWNFGRSRTGSSGTPVFEVPATEPRRSIETVPASMPTLPEIPSPPPFTTLKSPPTPPRTPTLPSRRHRKPYPTLMKPLPLSTHALFPNYTPSVHPSYRPAREVDPSLDADKTIPSKIDRRSLHFEVEDDSDGAIWSAGEAFWGGDGTKMAEWDAIEGIRKRWVGPMM